MWTTVWLKRYMKNLNRNILVVFFVILLIFFFFLFYKKENEKNIILIGWDGAQRAHTYSLLEDGKLPNLKNIINEGSIADIDITSSTHTKPGWAEILTGYSPGITGVYTNKEYGPIPKGYTVFERLEDYFGYDNFLTVFIGGKVNNIGSRGPHKICINCITRFPDTREKTMWWEEDTQAPTIQGQERFFSQRKGEPYFYTKDSLDIHETSLGTASNVGPKALASLEILKGKRFFAFFHFEEPDEPGHIYGENSKEYSQGIIIDDYWLGEIVSKLKELNMYENTIIYVTADHGFDEGKKSHSVAPFVFLATNDTSFLKDGDRKDVTPTILDNFGIDTSAINPSLNGKSLLSKFYFIENNIRSLTKFIYE